ncbi:MAG: hypothetical protein COA57_04410 [Flavobacteriales bacterium]|nr:MAG: hypothetical protein COA57_04410 [Flavobacteriales bacterium]
MLLIASLTATYQPLFSQTTWTGSTDTDWHKDCNWNTNTIPTCADDVIIPDLANDPDITGIAHCRTIEIQGAAILDLNSSGGGRLDVGQVGGCSGVPTDNGGCSISGCAWDGDGSLFVYSAFGSPCICIPTCSDQTICKIWTNNTNFDITVNLPAIGCASWGGGSTKVITALGSLNICLASTGCCPPNGTFGGTWTSTDGCSGAFSVEVINLL